MPLAKDVDLKNLASLTKSYSGADLEGLCREAALLALRKDINTKEVALSDFQRAIERVGPSILPDMETWYKGVMRQVRRVSKPTTPIA